MPDNSLSVLFTVRSAAASKVSITRSPCGRQNHSFVNMPHSNSRTYKYVTFDAKAFADMTKVMEYYSQDRISLCKIYLNTLEKEILLLALKSK